MIQQHDKVHVAPSSDKWRRKASHVRAEEAPCKRPKEGDGGVGREEATKPGRQVHSEVYGRGDGSAPRASASGGEKSRKQADTFPQPRQQQGKQS